MPPPGRTLASSGRRATCTSSPTCARSRGRSSSTTTRAASPRPWWTRGPRHVTPRLRFCTRLGVLLRFEVARRPRAMRSTSRSLLGPLLTLVGSQRVDVPPVCVVARWRRHCNATLTTLWNRHAHNARLWSPPRPIPPGNSTAFVLPPCIVPSVPHHRRPSEPQAAADPAHSRRPQPHTGRRSHRNGASSDAAALRAQGM